jgi:hypothetical protein
MLFACSPPPHVCGKTVCPAGAALDTTCEKDRCLITVAFDGSVSPGQLVRDGSNLYWAATQDGDILKTSLPHGTVVTLASGQHTPTSIAASGGTLYWSLSPDNAIVSMLASGGDIASVASAPSPLEIAIGAQTLYVRDGHADLESVPLSGGAVTTLSADAQGLATTADALYWVASGTYPETQNGAVVSWTRTGGGVATLATGQNNPRWIQLHGDALYWVNQGTDNTGKTPPGSRVADGAVVTLPLNGSAPVTLASGLSLPAFLAVDDDSVYWGTVASESGVYDGTIVKAPRAGGAATVIATGVRLLSNLEIDDTSLYWRDGGHVRRLFPK